MDIARGVSTMNSFNSSLTARLSRAAISATSVIGSAVMSSATTVAITLLLGIALAHATTVIETDSGGSDQAGPDILSMTGTYDTTTLHLSVSYASGTFNPSGTNSGVLIGLNTDFNTSTGCCTDPSVFFPIGAEYAVGYSHSLGTSFVLSSLVSGSASFVSNVIPTFVTDGLDLSIPLSLIGGSGYLEFGLVSGTDNGNGTFAPTDYLGDGSITFGPTSATPLPAALPLFATGLGGLGLLGWRRKRKNAAAAA
jgi:hypothetical protein